MQTCLSQFQRIEPRRILKQCIFEQGKWSSGPCPLEQAIPYNRTKSLYEESIVVFTSLVVAGVFCVTTDNNAEQGLRGRESRAAIF